MRSGFFCVPGPTWHCSCCCCCAIHLFPCRGFFCVCASSLVAACPQPHPSFCPRVPWIMCGCLFLVWHVFVPRRPLRPFLSLHRPGRDVRMGVLLCKSGIMSTAEASSAPRVPFVLHTQSTGFRFILCVLFSLLLLLKTCIMDMAYWCRSRPQGYKYGNTHTV